MRELAASPVEWWRAILSRAKPGLGDYGQDSNNALVQSFLDDWLPRLHSETRSYVTTCFGCTGGHHRSVYLAERLARHFREAGWEEVAVHHRELE